MSEEFDGWENIDWDIEIDTLEFDLMAIKSHNKPNPNVGKKWTEWPKDMSGIMLLPLGYQPSKWDKESPLTEKEEADLKQKWIDFAQFVDENDSISLKEIPSPLKEKTALSSHLMLVWNSQFGCLQILWKGMDLL